MLSAVTVFGLSSVALALVPVPRSIRLPRSGRASGAATSAAGGVVPAASFAANVGPVHWYSTGFTWMLGLAFSNDLTWLLNCWIASGVLPGISDTTLIVTDFPVAALEI